MSLVHSGQKLRDRLLRKSQMDPNGGCWLWGGYLLNGYGRLDVEGKKQFAHRASYAAFKGDTGGLSVLHKCDVPACCNPDHLFLGDHNANMADMARKRRRKGNGVAGRKGMTSPGARITDDDVRLIRSSPESSYHLAKHLPVSACMIRRIRRGLAWSHVQ